MRNIDAAVLLLSETRLIEASGLSLEILKKILDLPSLEILTLNRLSALGALSRIVSRVRTDSLAGTQQQKPKFDLAAEEDKKTPRHVQNVINVQNVIKTRQICFTVERYGFE